MEDKELENGEVEELNSEEAQEEQKTTFTAEEVEAMRQKMQSDSEKGVQKVISEKKAYQTALTEASKVANDGKYLVELHNNNPQVAKIILDTYFDGQDIEAYKESISYEEDYKDPKVIQSMVAKEAQRLAETEKIENAKQAFIEKLGMNGEELKNFEEAFEERKNLKSFKGADIQAHLKKAYLEIADLDGLEKIKQASVIGQATAKTSGKVETKSKDTRKQDLDAEIDAFNKKFNL